MDRNVHFVNYTSRSGEGAGGIDLSADRFWDLLGLVIAKFGVAKKRNRGRERTVVLRRYLYSNWVYVSDIVKNHIFEVIQDALESGTVCPSLYDMIGFASSQDCIHPWNTPIEQEMLTQAVKDFVTASNSNHCKRLRSILEDPESTISVDWSIAPPWAQVECLGYTEWSARETKKIKAEMNPEDFRKVTSEANKKLQNAYPTLENYCRILEWRDDPAPFFDIVPKHEETGTREERSSNRASHHSHTVAPQFVVGTRQEPPQPKVASLRGTRAVNSRRSCSNSISLTNP
ncbi:hypothetical protein JCM3765_000706 [Sporobolomyces pararoseus]